MGKCMLEQRRRRAVISAVPVSNLPVPVPIATMFVYDESLTSAVPYGPRRSMYIC